MREFKIKYDHKNKDITKALGIKKADQIKQSNLIMKHVTKKENISETVEDILSDKEISDNTILFLIARGLKAAYTSEIIRKTFCQ